MKTVLITGGAGYIGSHIGYMLAHCGYKVIILDNLLYGQSCNYEWATFIKGDFGSVELLQKVFSSYPISAVIHCAASIEVGESVRNPLLFYRNNVAHTITLLETMKRYGVKRILFSSSCAVFGVPLALPLKEEHPFNPISPYGRTKLMMEMAIQDAAHAYGLEYVIFRFFNAAGALPEHGLGERHIPETHLIPLLFQAAYERHPFILYGDCKPTHDGSCIRDFVHVVDIARAHYLAMSYLDAGNRSDIFNLGTGTGTSVKEMVHAVEMCTGLKVPVSVGPDRPGDPAILVADYTKARYILGWQPIHSDLESIIQSAHRFFIYTLKSERVHENFC